MKVIGIFEAKTKLTAVCEAVAATGEPAVISRRGRPLVKIVPVEEEDSDLGAVWERVEEWERANGAVRGGGWTRPPGSSTDRDALSDYWR